MTMTLALGLFAFFSCGDPSNNDHTDVDEVGPANVETSDTTGSANTDAQDTTGVNYSRVKK